MGRIGDLGDLEDRGDRGDRGDGLEAGVAFDVFESFGTGCPRL